MEKITVKEIVEATRGHLLWGSDSQPLSHISIDSRTQKGNDLFVPLIGERADAHDFISQAVENGAAACLTSRKPSDTAPQVPMIQVEDTRKALQDIGRYLRKRITIPLVGITGSVGKTTTREMIAAALTAGFQVFKTPANHNSQIGVPITISEIGSRDEIGVLELGMSEPGELTVIAQIARVHMAVITNIGVTHIEQLGTQENIYREKLTIQDGMEPGGVLFLNGDDPFLRHTRARDGIETVYYGTGSHCDYRAVDIHTDEQGYPEFTAVCESGQARVKLRVMGLHNVINAMVSLAVAHRQGIQIADAAKALASYEGFHGRQQIYRKNNMTIIDDTYNASPVSMKAGLQVLDSMEHGSRRIAVLADMKELGKDARLFHEQVGAYAGTLRLDCIAVLGQLAACIAKGARKANPDLNVQEFSDKQELIRFLDTLLQPGDCVLFKGSNSMKLGEVAAKYL